MNEMSPGALAQTTYSGPIFDCDTHMYEVDDAWSRYLPKQYAKDYDTRFRTGDDGDFALYVGDRKIEITSNYYTEDGRVAPPGKLHEWLRAMKEGKGEVEMRVPKTPDMYNRDARLTKMDEFGVRYIVWLDGFTETSGRTGSISCTIGPGGAGCFGFGTWEDDASFDARIWDVSSATSVGTINTDANGQSYLPALVIPIPLIARVEANACSRLASQLKDFVNGS